ncbi:MAG: Uma2 family endonuclease, partial [Blastocatellia bacterium]
MERLVERSKAKTTLKDVRPQPLHNGDRLTRSEFERRYKAMPHIKKAELIEGVVYMPSPVRFEQHAEPHASIVGALVVYRAATPGVRSGDNTTIRLDLDNEPQPDLALLIDPPSGGRTRISQDGYLEGGPELIVEVAASSASYDLHDKLNAYRRNGVQEYIVWRVEEGEIDWFRLESEIYARVKPDARGIIRSRVFPGLWLNIKAMLADDLAKVLADLQKGLKSREH